jgi:hypothetical protein
MAEYHTIRDKRGKLRDVVVTPGRSIRLHCIECVGGFHDVKDCQGVDCHFYPYRLGKGRPSVKVIRRECVKCMNGQYTLIGDCPSKHCALHPFRMGKIPSLAGRKFGQKRKQVGLENS